MVMSFIVVVSDKPDMSGLAFSYGPFETNEAADTWSLEQSSRNEKWWYNVLPFERPDFFDPCS